MLSQMPNSEVGRHRLLEPEAGRAGSEGGSAEPVDVPEGRLLGIYWPEWLAATQVGVDDDFFELGRACRWWGACSCESKEFTTAL